MKVLLIGIGYFPNLTAGDKNFFYQLVPLLMETGKIKLEIVSINDQEENIFIQKFADYKVKIHNLKRPFHLNRKRFYRIINNKIFYYHHHKSYQEIMERFLTIVLYEKFIANLIKTLSIDLIHFMDNFGPAMPYLKKKFPDTKTTYAPATYSPRGKFYDWYLKYSFNKLDRIFPFTRAYKQILSDLRIPEYKMEVIPWGIKLFKRSLSFKERDLIKKKFCCRTSNLLFLWSGWLQQIQEKDFYYSIEEAKKITKRYQDIEFIFTFKPEIYQERYSFESRDRIRVITNVDDFGLLLEAADIFFSPVGEKNSTVSPPLTWLEAMARGTPIFTTKVRGVEELVLDGENGFIAKDFSDILYKTEEIRRSDLNFISVNAKRFVGQNFNIKKTAVDYIKFWQKTVNNR